MDHIKSPPPPSPGKAPSWVWHWIPEEGLDALKTYAYTGTDLSFLVRLFLTRFWNWSMRFVPWTVAPNMITLFGFFGLLINPLMCINYCGDNFTHCEVPRWYFLVFAFNLFIYQLMDNLDGKQARRTGNSSALGELFDHGCDSLFMLLWALPHWVSVGNSPWEMFIAQSLGMLIFFASHWEEYHTNELTLPEFANPTEGQFVFMGVMVWAYFTGPGWWGNSVTEYLPFLAPYGITTYRNVLNYIIIPVGIIGGTASGNGLMLYKWCKKNRYSFLYASTVLLPIILQAIFLGLWVRRDCLLERNPATVLALHGMMGSFITDQLMVSRICKMPAPRFPSVLLFSLVGLLNSYFGFVNSQTMLFLVTASAYLTFFYWCTSVSLQLAHHLNIPILTLKPNSLGPDSPQNKKT